MMEGALTEALPAPGERQICVRSGLVLNVTLTLLRTEEKMTQCW